MTNRKIVIVAIVAVMIVAGLTVWISMNRFSRTLPEPNYTFSGTGDGITGEFPLEKGQAYFTVKALDENGYCYPKIVYITNKEVDIDKLVEKEVSYTFDENGVMMLKAGDELVGEINYWDSMGLRVYDYKEDRSASEIIKIPNQGNFMFHVLSNCRWTISITQPVPENQKFS